MSETRLGRFTLHQEGAQRSMKGQTAKKNHSQGNAEIFVLSGEELALEIGVIDWANGDREVKCLSRLDSPEPMDQVVGRLRISIDFESRGRCKLRLRTPRLGSRERPTLHSTTLDELNTIVGMNVAKTLLEVGAIAVGPAKQILADHHPTRSDLYVVTAIGPDLALVSAVAYALGVGIPMYVRFGGSQGQDPPVGPGPASVTTRVRDMGLPDQIPPSDRLCDTCFLRKPSALFDGVNSRCRDCT